MKPLTAVADEEQLDEVVVVGPGPRRRRRHPRALTKGSRSSPRAQPREPLAKRGATRAPGSGERAGGAASRNAAGSGRVLGGRSGTEAGGRAGGGAREREIAGGVGCGRAGMVGVGEKGGVGGGAGVEVVHRGL